MTPPDEVPPSDDGEPIPPMPGEDETPLVDVLAPWDVEDVQSRKIYVDNVVVKIVAQRVEYLDPS